MEHDAIAAVAALQDPERRRAYLHVMRAGGPVSREDLATALGIGRRHAATILEYLLARGLFRVTYARPPGRSGPGAGRTSKFYEAVGEATASVPARRYDLVARMLLAALEDARPGETGFAAALRVAGERGRGVGESVRAGAGDAPVRRAQALLARHGYDPVRSGESLVPRNCPFRSLAADHDGVCEMNRRFLEGFASGIGTLTAEAAPVGSACCVQLRIPETERGTS